MVGAIGGIAVAGVAGLGWGQIGRDRLTVLDELPAALGGRPDVAACETYIRGVLKTPSTYRRASVQVIDSGPLSQAAFDQQSGLYPIPKPSAAEAKADSLLASEAQLDAIRRSLMQGREQRLRTLLISYDAENGFGAPIRSQGACQFRLLDGELEDAGTLKRHADSVASSQKLGELGVSTSRRSAPRFACCIL